MATIKIKKNRHYHSNWWFHLWHFFARGKSEYSFVFGDGCWYEYKNKDSEDWNKVHGVRSWKHLKNEAILVWKPDFDKVGMFRVGFYTREESKIWFKELKKRYTKNDLIYSKVQVLKNGYGFVCGNEYFDKLHTSPKGVRSIQPYFGGNNKAPHNMSLRLT